MNYLIWDLFGPASWPVWLTLLAAVGFLIGSVRLARWAVMLGALYMIAFAILPTGDWLMHRLESRYPRPAPPPAGIDAIAVLAGAEKLRASAASGSLELGKHGERVGEALTLAQRYPAARVWIVGGIERDGRRDVDWTADYWRRAGLAPGRIGKIAGTLDTCANARGIAKTLPGQRVLLVTSGFHMPRAMACMKAAGVDAVPYAVDRQSLGRGFRSFSKDLNDNIARSDAALHEIVGLAYYRLTGRIDSL